MKDGKAIDAALRDGKQGGIPWFAILDPTTGERLTTSDAEGTGNVGYPVEPHEIAHFVKMLEKTAVTMQAEDIAGLKTRLEAKAAQIKSARR